MKKFNLVFALVALFSTSVAFAQDTQNKWLIGVGAHATDHTSVRGAFSGFFDTDDYSIAPPLSKLTVSRSLNNSFAVDFQASVGEMDNKRLKIEDEFFILAGLGLRYKLANGYILDENSWFDPYVRIGANYHKYAYDGINISASNPMMSYDNDYTEGGNPNDVNGSLLQQDFTGQDNNFIVNGGVGINFWLTKNFGLNVESQYNWAPAVMPDYINFFQHSVAAVFKFGKPKGPCDDKGGDTDGDGICNADDKCVDVPGKVEFEGCPDACTLKGGDTDNDGVCDADDKCVNKPGPASNNGCPVDPCANKGGDTDGDGVCNADDKCPNIPGGDTDGDGVCDRDDKCVDVPGPASNAGCPVKVEELITKALEGLIFDVNKATIKKGQEDKINLAYDYLVQYPNENFFVDGHTDSDGSDKYNLDLSKRRAQTVVKALEAKGVAKGRLSARGFGESSPKCDNTTPEGKQCNRRVAFTK